MLWILAYLSKPSDTNRIKKARDTPNIYQSFFPKAYTEIFEKFVMILFFTIFICSVESKKGCEDTGGGFKPWYSLYIF